MTERRNQSRARRPAVQKPSKEPGLWSAVPTLDGPEPIELAPVPGALIASLGPPSLRGSGSNIEYYLVSVVDRAAALAAALAASAHLLVEPDDDTA